MYIIIDYNIIAVHIGMQLVETRNVHLCYNNSTYHQTCRLYFATSCSETLKSTITNLIRFGDFSMLLANFIEHKF